MALSSSTIQPASDVSSTPVKGPVNNDVVASLLSAVVLSIYAGQKSRKQFRKLKRKMAWLVIKEKIKAAFKPADLDRKTLTIILLAVLVLALVFISPIAALVLAILGLILILAGVI